MAALGTLVRSLHRRGLGCRSLFTRHLPDCYDPVMKSQEGMLRDMARVDAYKAALEAVAPQWQGATVMDIGTGSGIIATLAARMGAKRVYAVEASQDMAQVASRLACSNGFSDVVEVLPKRLEEITEQEVAPGSVDVIVSELFSHFLVDELGLQVVSEAKRRFLRQDGLVLPAFAQLKLAPFEDKALGAELRERHSFWSQRDFYGLDLSPALPLAQEQALHQNILGLVDPSKLIVEPADTPGYTIDLAGPDDASAWKRICFELAYSEEPRSRDAVVDGLCGWWDAYFSNPNGGPVPQLRTGPGAPATVWTQCRFMLDRPLAVAATAELSVFCELRVHQERESYILRLKLVNHSTRGVARAGPVELNNVYAHTAPTRRMKAHFEAPEAQRGREGQRAA